MELVTLTAKEIRRLEVLQALAAGSLQQAQAARLLDLSVRQVKRLWRRYRQGGPAALASARRERVPNNALDPALKTRVLELYRANYADFGPTFAAEKLQQRDAITISRETLRKWLIAEDLWKAAKRRATPRPPRARRQCFGELVQIDGSPHAWFGDRGPRCSLLVAIDDATGNIGAALFSKAETTNAYFELFTQYFDNHGLPEAFYSDRHSIFRINTQQTKEHQTQIGRALDELDIDLICANSPQAKGRVERANRTLQDRLTKELGLRGISNMVEGNAFLPQFLSAYNAKFAKAPALEFDAHRSGKPFNLPLILCQRTERTLSKNLTIQFDDCIYALTDACTRQQLRIGMRVQLHLPRDGELLITRDGHRLEHRLVMRLERNAPIIGAKELAERPAKRRSMPEKARTPRPDHPWKRYAAPPRRDTSELHSGDITALR